MSIKINFDACIAHVVEAAKGVVSEKDAGKIIIALTQKIQNSNNKIQARVETRLHQASKEFVAEIDKVAEINKRNALMTETAVRNFTKSAEMFPKPFEGMLAYFEDTRKFANQAGRGINAIKEGYISHFLGTLKARLEKAGVLSEFMKDTHVRQIYQEFYKKGSSGSKIAKSIRDIMYSLKEEAVKLQNLHGSYINFMPEHVKRTTYSQGRIKAEFGPDRFKSKFNFQRFLTPEEHAQTFEKFADFFIPLLDKEKTFKDANPKEFLRGAFDGIMSGEHGPEQKANGAEINSSFFAAGSLAKRASQQRLFHFKDGDAAYTAYSKLSTDPLSGSFVRELEHASRNIALMQQLGPNPEGTLKEVIKNLLYKYSRAGEEEKHDNLKSNQHKLFASLSALNGALNIPENPTLATATQSVISTIGMMKLGKILFFAMPDRALVHSVLTKHGIGAMDALGDTLKMRPPAGSQDRLRLTMMGGELRSFISSVGSRFTTGSESYLPSTIGKLQSAYFRMTGIHWSDDLCNAAILGSLPRHLGSMSDREYENLTPEYQKMFKMFGISSKEWDAWRSTAYSITKNGDQVPGIIGHENWISPDQFDKIPDSAIDELLKDREIPVSDNNRLRQRDLLQNKFHAWLSAQRDEGILMPGTKEHRQATFGTKSGTALGSAVRLIMMFKSWPLAVYNRIMTREIHGGGARTMIDWMKMEKNSNFHTTQLVALSTIAGYLSITLDDAIAGKNPRRFFDKNGEFDTTSSLSILRDSFLRGNAASLYSDLILREMDTAYNNVISTIGGPGLNTAIQGVGTLSKDLHGGGTAKNNLNFIRQNIPFGNLFYVKPALDHLVWFNIQEMLNPGSLKEMERQHDKKLNQDFWLPPSEIHKDLIGALQ